VTKASLTLTLFSLLAGCNDLSTAGSQAVTVPSSPCDTAGAPVLQGAITLQLSAPRVLVSGTTAPVTATATDSNGNQSDVTRDVTWSSSNLLAASAGPDGTLYAIGAGSATIRATLGEVTASIDVSIAAITLVSLSITADTETVRAGGTAQWHVTGNYNDGSTADLTASANWTTSDAGIAVIGQPGQIRAMGAGMAMVSAALSGQQASAPFMVTSAALADLRIEGSTTMSAEGTQQLVATGIYGDGGTVDMTELVGWYTSDGSVATVSLGRVQAVSSGTVTITIANGDLLSNIDLTLE
jgi:hypothetical protein